MRVCGILWGPVPCLCCDLTSWEVTSKTALLEVRYGVGACALPVRSQCLAHLMAFDVRWQWLSTAKLLPRCLISALGSLLERPHRIVMLKPKFIFLASRSSAMMENSRFLLDFETAA